MNFTLNLKVMKTKALIFSVLVISCTLAFAQPEFRNERMQRNREMMHKGNIQNRKMAVAQLLNLSDAQKEEFKKAMIDLHKQLLPIKNELGELKAKQRSLITAEKPDMSAINKNIEKMGQVQTEIAKIKTKHHLAMRAQLTDEQKLKSDMMRQKANFGKGNRNRNDGRL